jgi:hypothetical protein
MNNLTPQQIFNMVMGDDGTMQITPQHSQNAVFDVFTGKLKDGTIPYGIANPTAGYGGSDSDIDTAAAVFRAFNKPVEAPKIPGHKIKVTEKNKDIVGSW